MVYKTVHITDSTRPRGMMTPLIWMYKTMHNTDSTRVLYTDSKQMKRYIHYPWFLPAIMLLSSLSFFSCAGETAEMYLESHLHGRLTVSSELDTTTDYSGIVLLVTEGAGEQTDTLIFTETDRDGFFEATARFRKRGQFPLQIKRYGNLISASYIILAPGDSVRLEAELPEFTRTRKISSREHDAFNVYERLQRNYSRIASYINSGVMPQDTIPAILDTWSGLFWSVRESYGGTLAAEYSSLAAVEMLHGWNDDLMMEYIAQVLNPDLETYVTLSVYGANGVAGKKGLDKAVSYLDSLTSIAANKQDQVALQMRKIEILGDSAKTEEALTSLRQLSNNYDDLAGISDWAANMITDMERFAPGKPMPDFTIYAENGLSISNGMLMGNAYLLEIVELADPRYQGEYPLINYTNMSYAPMGLQIITVPVDDDPILKDAFFEERERNWTIADDRRNLGEELFGNLNIRAVPTRFLIDRNGRIVRKYVDRDISHVLMDLDEMYN